MKLTKVLRFRGGTKSDPVNKKIIGNFVSICKGVVFDSFNSFYSIRVKAYELNS